MPPEPVTARLKNEVTDQNLCTYCGACLNLCPHIVAFRGRAVAVHQCDREEGRCLARCPRTDLDWAEAARFRFGDYDPIKDGPIGRYRELLSSRAAEDEFRWAGQTGGTVSALAALALEHNLVDQALLTTVDHGQTTGKLIGDRAGVLACAGSTYVSGPTLAALNRALAPGRVESDRLALIGLPCHIQAAVNMARTEGLEFGLLIGLFCFWSFDGAAFKAKLGDRLGDRVVRRVDIGPPPDRLAIIETDRGEERIPVDDLRDCIRSGCSCCPDLTSELADLSVGTTEGKPGWNTVVVRSDKGAELIETARRNGALEIQAPPEGYEDKLAQAGYLKKRRALDALKDRFGLERAYLDLPPELLDRIDRDGKEAGR